MEVPGLGKGRGWRARVLRVAGPVMPGPGAGVASLSWIGEERIAVGGVPRAGAVMGLAGRGVTHVVNCRSREEAHIGGDLAAERTAFGAARVAHAPMRDLGLRQRPRLWAQAALFAARVLDDQPGARVLIHCTACADSVCKRSGTYSAGSERQAGDRGSMLTLRNSRCMS